MGELTVEPEETLGRKAYREIRDSILSGSLKPGSRLSMRRLAGSLSMSLAPVGEALRELARDGLVESEAGWGARVRKIDATVLRDQHILRTALECEAARHCARSANAEQLQELQDLAAVLDRHIDRHDDPKQVHQLDARFHLRIAELSGSEALVEGLRSNQLVRLLAVGSQIAHDLRRAPKQHIRLASEIASRDPDRAERCMREHCEDSMKLQLGHLTQSTT